MADPPRVERWTRCRGIGRAPSLSDAARSSLGRHARDLRVDLLEHRPRSVLGQLARRRSGRAGHRAADVFPHHLWKRRALAVDAARSCRPALPDRRQDFPRRDEPQLRSPLEARRPGQGRLSAQRGHHGPGEGIEQRATREDPGPRGPVHGLLVRFYGRGCRRPRDPVRGRLQHRRAGGHRGLSHCPPPMESAVSGRGPHARPVANAPLDTRRLASLHRRSRRSTHAPDCE